jgi:hypothetical protein
MMMMMMMMMMYIYKTPHPKQFCLWHFPFHWFIDRLNTCRYSAHIHSIECSWHNGISTFSCIFTSCE